jgi:hypothetical protein
MFSCSKISYLQFCDICGYEKMLGKNFPPSLLVLLLDTGSGINISDPRHWKEYGTATLPIVTVAYPDLDCMESVLFELLWPDSYLE